MTSNESKSFGLLHTQIQYWVWQQEWNELRDVQEQAIPVILGHEADIIISASTASGKTEAAFLPILTHMLEREGGLGLTLYISPLTALINDRFPGLLHFVRTCTFQFGHGMEAYLQPLRKNFFNILKGYYLLLLNH